ncbi:MAG: N-acetylglucosamine kinase [Propioniciclava sp.]
MDTADTEEATVTDSGAGQGATLALDAGQTGVKARLHLARTSHDLDLPGVRTDLPLHPQLARTVDAARRAAGLTFHRLAVGTTGLTAGEADAAPLLDLVRHQGIAEVYLAHDSVSSYLGALGDSCGAVVAAGTGSIILARGTVAVARVDGWGHIMGDAGSGFWIGREALRAAMRAHDGRGPATALVRLVRDRWPDVEDAYIDLQTDPEWVRRVASLSRDTAALAETDAEAERICRSAGEQLAVSVVTALSRVDEPRAGQTTPVATLGQVFGSAVVRQQFGQTLAELLPSVVMVEPAGTGLDGVSLLPDIHPGHPLHGLVSRAR